MTRATCLYLLGAASVAVGVHAATIAHGNAVMGAELSADVHACDDARVRIQVVGARIDARVAELRAEFVRIEAIGPGPLDAESAGAIDVEAVQ